MPNYNDPRELITDLILWFGAIRDVWPSFETRMINRERRFRLRYAEGKITAERLSIELDAIRQKREDRTGK